MVCVNEQGDRVVCDVKVEWLYALVSSLSPLTLSAPLFSLRFVAQGDPCFRQ